MEFVTINKSAGLGCWGEDDTKQTHGPCGFENSQDAKCQFEVVYGGVAKEKIFCPRFYIISWPSSFPSAAAAAADTKCFLEHKSHKCHHHYRHPTMTLFESEGFE